MFIHLLLLQLFWIVIRSFHWTYVSVVYSDTEYGNNGYDLLSAAAKQQNICISNPQEINAERFKAEDYERIIKTLMHKINARGKFCTSGSSSFVLELKKLFVVLFFSRVCVCRSNNCSSFDDGSKDCQF